MTLRIGPGLALPLEAITETFGVVAKRGAGKRLALETPLPTPAGWTTMQDVKVGDALFDEQGNPCRVGYVSPVIVGDSYRVCFSDGSDLVADSEHLWLTWDKPARRGVAVRAWTSRQKVLAGRDASPDTTWAVNRPQCQIRTLPAIRTTAEIAATLVHRSPNGLEEANHSIRNALPLALPEAAFPIPPYLLGLWLGDGTASDGVITSSVGDDLEVVDNIRACGYQVRERPSQRKGNVTSWRVLGLRVQLRSLDLLGRKHIPLIYKRASISQRLSLLRGICDSDGGWSNRNVEIALSNRRLAEDVYEIVVSLGMRASWSSRIPRLNGRAYRRSFRVRFRPLMQTFCLRRKADRYVQRTTERPVHRYITAVEKTVDRPMRCIAVDNPSGLFLAGRQMVPTHNTYTILVMVEEMLKAHLPVALVDPMGVCWGLRASHDGRAGGLPILIVGGEHGDLPLEPAAGAVMADFLVDHRQSVVLDISLWRKRQQKTFVTDFAERLYQRNRQPLHLVLDEADMFAPQRPFKGEEVMLGAIEDLVRRGRARGIGVSLVTQRTAVLNKDVLTQCEVLVALRTIAPQDIDAVDAWVKRHASAEQRERFLTSLPSLPIGTAWFWSPGWLDVFKQVRVRQRDTFDSSATPKVGQKVKPPKRLAPVDMETLKARIASTIERAKSEDPRLLRHRIAELEAELRKRPTQHVETKVQVERVEVEVPAPASLATARDASERLARTAEDLRAQAGALTETAQGLYRDADIANSAAGQLRDSLVPRQVAVPSPKPTPRQNTRATVARSERATTDATVHLRKGERRMLSTVGRMSVSGVNVNRRQLATLSGFSPKGGTYASYLGTLKREGLVAERDGLLSLTSRGETAVLSDGGYAEGPMSTQEILDLWRGSLRKGEREMLDLLVLTYPNGLSRSALAIATGFQETGGTFASYLGTLKRNGLVVSRDGLLFADSLLTGNAT